jgi:hypothetical protein
MKYQHNTITWLTTGSQFFETIEKGGPEPDFSISKRKLSSITQPYLSLSSAG